MLTPDYLAGLPDAILKLWEEAELTILKDMARRISTYDYWIPAADYQNERLLVSGRTQDEILSVLAGVTKKSEAELRKMMVDAGSRCLQDDIEIYTAAGLTPPAIADSKELTAILNEGYKATAQTMKNLTRTTARTATRQFEDALDTAWTQVSSGAMDAESAIRQALKGLSEKGIEAITYPESGRVDSIETAVRRAVLTGVNQTSARLQEELADELGCDLVEVSAHAGARPEHAAWQGKIYSRSGTSEKYPEFRSATGYGTGAGLCGWNCRHTFGPYIEGSPRVWTDEKLEELNAPKYEYNGEQLTEYEARQKEKYFDRQIQRWNREAAAMKAAGLDDSEARQKVKDWKGRKWNFIRNRKEIGSIEAIDDLPDVPVKLIGRKSSNTIANAIASKGRVPFEEITGHWYPNATPGSHEVKDLLEYTAPDGKTYKVDGFHVKLTYTRHEKEIAELLEREIGGEIYMVPKVDFPLGVRTPDYLFHGKPYDLKTIEGSGKNVISSSIGKKKDQSPNFILDTDPSPLNTEEIVQQVKRLYSSKFTQFVDEVVVIKDSHINCVYRRKKED